MRKRYLYGSVIAATLSGAVLLSSTTYAARTPDVSENAQNHSTEWNGNKGRPQGNVTQRAEVNPNGATTLQLGGQLVRDVMPGRPLQQSKLPKGNLSKVSASVPVDPVGVAMSKEAFAAVLYEGTIGNQYSTKNYIGKFSVTEAPAMNLDRVVGYIQSPYYGCFNLSNNYIVNYVNGSGANIYGVQWQMYNAETWMSWGGSSIDKNNAYTMYDTAYDPTTPNLIYGWMGKLPASDETIGWYRIDMTTPSFTLISQPQIEVRGVACSLDGQFYAIDASGKLYKVEKSTGVFTEIGNTGAVSEFRTTAAVDQLSGLIYYVTCNTEGSSLYRIDPATAKGTKIYDFPQLMQFSNLYFGPRKAVDGAPNVPQNLTTTFSPGSLSGAIEFDAPEFNYDEESSAGRLAYTISLTWTSDPVSGATETKEYTGSAGYGEHVKEYITLSEARRFTIKVRCSNEAGDGPWTQDLIKYLGPDAPDTPYSFKGSYTDGKWVLTWDKHGTTGANGGDMNPDDVKYILTFMPGGRQVITEGGATSYEEEMAEPEEFQHYYWTCQAATDWSVAGNVRSTAKVGLGKIYPYYKEDFSTYTTSTKNDALAGFTTFHNAEKHGDWAWVSPQWINIAFYRGYDADSYLVLPKLYLYGGRYYTFNFTVGKYGNAYGNPEFRVLMGNEPTAEGLSEVLMDRTTANTVAGYTTRGETGNAYSVTFMPEHDGVYYIAFNHCNKNLGVSGNAGLYNMRVGNLEITSPIIPGAPTQVINLKADADIDGNQQATISFTCPRENMGGTALMGMTRAEIKRGDIMVADVPLTGSTFKWIDKEPAMGLNSYTVTPYNDNGAGNPASTSCYVGLAEPADVQTLTAAESDAKGTVNLSWAPVTKDVNGKNLKNVKYVLIRNLGVENEIVAENLTATEYSDKVSNGAQYQAVYGVKAITADGYSPNWAASQTLLIGEAYPTPYIESLEGGYLRTLLIGEASNSYGSWQLFYDDDLAGIESVDHDNGFIGFYSQFTGTQGALTTGRISIPAELKNPVLSFYYFLMPDGENTINVLIRTDDNPNYEQLAVFVAGKEGPNWQIGAVDMTPYLGKTVRMTFVVTTNSHAYTILDRIAIHSLADADINNVKISAPSKANLNDEIEINVEYLNAAYKPAMDYKVILLRDGNKVAEIEGDSVAICDRGHVTFKDVIPQTAGEQFRYEARVEIEGDENASDNTTLSPAIVQIIKPELPIVTNLSGARKSETEVELSWTAPDMDTRPLETVTESFEGLTTGDTQIDGWINLDLDKHAVGFGGSSNITFPGLVNNESPAPWLAVNTTENNCDPARTGDVFMGACYLTDKSTNDDWLISPELSGMEQTVSVWARSYTNFYGGDRIEILYSNGSTDPKDFISVFEYPYVPTSWTECKADLPKGANYFAIRCTSIYQIMLCVDDVTYSPKGASYQPMNLLGYNVWRDGVKLNEQPLTQPAFVDTTDEYVHTYQITSVYNIGESASSNQFTADAWSSVNDINSDNAAVFVKNNTIIVENAGMANVTVNTLGGNVIFSGIGDTEVNVNAGVYVVTAGAKAYKVIVK